MFQILCIGAGEGGGKIAHSAVDFANIVAINTNKQDLDVLDSIPESKKLLLNISAGGTGKDPLFIKESLKKQEVRAQIKDFISSVLNTTPLFTHCPHCSEKNRIKDTEAVGDNHSCIKCDENFGIINISKEDSIKPNYIFIFVCLGGGSGSGLAGDLIDICYNSFNLPIGVVASLPEDSEDITTKINAMSIFKELYNTYAINGLISPLILVDNQKMIETYDLPVGKMYPTINKAITNALKRFNEFSNQTSKYMSTIDAMDTARLWSLGGCCTIGKFIIGNSKIEQNSRSISVPHPLDIEAIDNAIINSTFVDGFDLSSAKGVGIIAIAPEHFLQDENISKCIRYVFSKAKDIIGDGLIFRGQYNDQNTDCLEFYIFFNGLKYPEERFARMWQDIKDGKVISQKKKDRIEELPYDIKMESSTSGKNFQRLQNLNLDRDESQSSHQPEQAKASLKQCTNCFIDPLSKRSMGVYRKGGPVPFEKGQCPVCNGKGKA